MPKFNHNKILPNNPMLMCICGSSGGGKTFLTFKMLTTPDFLDYDNLYIYTTTLNQSYYQFLRGLEWIPKSEIFNIFIKYEEGEQDEEIHNILSEYIENNHIKKPTEIRVVITKNLNDLNLLNINSSSKNLIIFDDCVSQKNQSVQQEFFTKGRHHGCHCIYQSQSFYGMDGMYIRKNANCFILFELNDRDLSQTMQSINHGMDKPEFKKQCRNIWKNPEDYGYIFINIRKQAGERVMTYIC